MGAQTSSNLQISEAAARVSCTAALGDDVGRLRYVSAKRAEVLARLGIATVRDLLLHIPHRYLDFSELSPIGLTTVGEQATVIAQVDRVELKRPRPRMQLVEVSVLDETGVLIATFFRQPWIADQIHEGDLIALSGKVNFSYGFKRMSSPFFEVLDAGGEQATYQRVLPVHPVSEGISPAWMRRIISAALADAGDVADFLPATLVAEHGLMSWARALRQIHFPHTIDAAEQARRRLAYDELLCLQLALLARRRIRLAGATPTEHTVDGAHLAALRAALPFSLSEEQERCVVEILADMAAPEAMSRLLLGDVGTGKTAVAAFGLAAVADTGTQAAMMAPTSVLATQYAASLGPLLDEAHVSWALVIGATPAAERAQATASIAAGRTSVVFGTTALLSSDIQFKHLSFVVIDEQHRFGVDQRTALRRKGPGADMLMMSATPIPRTLALSLYGDLSCSRIRTRPRAGAGVETVVDTPENLDRAYTAIREALAAGHQAYVVCPLVDESDSTGVELADLGEEQASSAKLHAATTTYQELSSRGFADARVGLLTGRMSAAEKDEVMDKFRAGSIDILVATTVVEVGVDVPNATAMLIFDADRFGLATLHQLRGRVGRGDVAGVVHLATTARKGTPARKRLSALEKSSDGEALAELDLKLRHEGEVLGYRQHGTTLLQVTDLATDADLIAWAHTDAASLAAEDPELTNPQHRPLAFEVHDRYTAYFEEERG